MEPVRPAAIPAGATDHGLIVLDIRERHGAALIGFARRLGLNDDAAEDAVQETLLRLFRELAGGRDVRDPRAWCFHTLYRVVIDEHRLRARVAAIRERLLRRSFPLVHVDPDAATQISIWATVDRLPARQRQVLYLHYRADLPFEDVAVVLGITAGGARRIAAKGIERLRILVPSAEDPR